MKTIKNYSKYQIYLDGRVFTTRLRKGWLTPGTDKNGYMRFSMVGDNGIRKGMYAHQLVALAYLSNPESKPFVNHKDHDKSNNTVENLEWCTHLENIRHDWAQGTRRILRGEELASVNTDKKVKEIRKLFDSGDYTQTELSHKFNMPFPTIHVIVRRKQWRHI